MLKFPNMVRRKRERREEIEGNWDFRNLFWKPGGNGSVWTYSYFSRYVTIFLNPKLKSHQMVLSSSGIRGGKFISVLKALNDLRKLLLQNGYPQGISTIISTMFWIKTDITIATPCLQFERNRYSVSLLRFAKQPSPLLVNTEKYGVPLRTKSSKRVHINRTVQK